MGSLKPPPGAALSLSSELGTLLSRARRLSLGAVVRGLEASGESFFAWQMLVRLIRSGPLSQRALAQSTTYTEPVISRLLVGLERQGLVRRRRPSSDRRRREVEITPRGLAAFRRMEPLVAAAVDSVMTPLSKAERRALRELLARVVDFSERAPGASSPAA